MGACGHSDDLAAEGTKTQSSSDMNSDRQTINFSLICVGGKVSIQHRGCDINVSRHLFYDHDRYPCRNQTGDKRMFPGMQSSLDRRIKRSKEFLESSSQDIISNSPCRRIGENQIAWILFRAESLQNRQQLIRYFNFVRAFSFCGRWRIEDNIALKINIFDPEPGSLSDPAPGSVEKFPQITSMWRGSLKNSSYLISVKKLDMLGDLLRPGYSGDGVIIDPAHTDTEIKPDRNDTGFISDGIRVAQLSPKRYIPLDHFRSYVADKNSIGEVIFKKLDKMSDNNPISCPGPVRGVFSGDRRDPLFDRLHDGDRGSRFPSQNASGQLDFNLFQKRLGQLLFCNRNFRRLLDSQTAGQIITDVPFSVSWIKTRHFDLHNYNYTGSAKKHQKLVKWLRYGDVSVNREGFAEGTVRLAGIFVNHIIATIPLDRSKIPTICKLHDYARISPFWLRFSDTEIHQLKCSPNNNNNQELFSRAA